jgi:transposase-like protein
MAGRQQYTDEAKAAAFTALEVNDGNKKRTARELGLPLSTLRRWSDEWEKGKNLPAAEDLVQATGDFIEDAERVRNLALKKMEAKLLNNEGTVAQIATVMGILDDKIARAKGLADRVTEHKITLPSRDEIVHALQGLQQGAIEAAQDRDEVIVEAELAALPAAK